MFVEVNGKTARFGNRLSKGYEGNARSGATLSCSDRYNPMGDWDDGNECPPVDVLGIARDNPLCFKRFRDADDLRSDPEFVPSGLTYGGEVDVL
jgi:hypothetical protein